MRRLASRPLAGGPLAAPPRIQIRRVLAAEGRRALQGAGAPYRGRRGLAACASPFYGAPSHSRSADAGEEKQQKQQKQQAPDLPAPPPKAPQKVQKQAEQQQQLLFEANAVQLSPEESALVAREKDVLKALIGTLRAYTMATFDGSDSAGKTEIEGEGGLEKSDSDVYLLESALKRLDDLFLLVVCGEFNSGKSTVLNALLGGKYLKMGITPTTSKIGMLRYLEEREGGNSPSPSAAGAEQPPILVEPYPENPEECEVVRVPVPWLKQVSLVDTPGTNAVVLGHQQITEHFIPSADVVLFVTGCDRAFTKSEKDFLELIRTYRKNILVVLSKADLLLDQEEEDAVVSFVTENFHNLLGMDPNMFLVSARSALRAKLAAQKTGASVESSPHWEISRFGAVEDFILRTLGSRERLRIKLGNPLGLGQHVCQKFLVDAERRRQVLQGDEATLAQVQDVVATWEKDTMSNDFQAQAARIDNVFLEIKSRGNEFLDRELTLTSLPTMVMARMGGEDLLKSKFESEVIEQSGARIEKYVGTAIDWLLNKNQRLWRDVSGKLEARANVSVEDIARADNDSGSANALVDAAMQTNRGFDVDRTLILDRIDETAKNVMSGSGLGKDAASSVHVTKLAKSIQTAWYATAGIEIGALGIGSLLTTSLFDFTGILAASTVAAIGLGVLPYKRRQLKAEFGTRVDDARGKLQRSLTEHFEDETQSAGERVRAAVEPYQNFTRARSAAVERHATEFKDHAKELERLQKQVDATLSGSDSQLR